MQKVRVKSKTGFIDTHVFVTDQDGIEREVLVDAVRISIEHGSQSRISLDLSGPLEVDVESTEPRRHFGA